MSVRLILASVAVLALLVAVTACGGPGSTHYSREKTEKCLRSAGVNVDPGTADDIATNASEGALGVTLPGNFVSLAFSDTVHDAEQVADQYKTSANPVVVKRKGTVILAWDNDPSGDEKDKVQSCLKS